MRGPFIVAPRYLRLARLGLAYQNRQITRREYDDLYELELSLLRSENRRAAA